MAAEKINIIRELGSMTDQELNTMAFVANAFRAGIKYGYEQCANDHANKCGKPEEAKK